MPRVEKGRQDSKSRLFISVTGQPKRNQRIVVRPDRAVVVGHGIITRLGGCDRSPAPAAEKGVAEQVLLNPGGRIRLGDAGERALRRVGASYPARLFRAVQSDRVSLDLLAPKCLVKLFLALRCLRSQV